MKDIALTLVVGVLVLTAALSPVGCTMYESRLVTNLIAHGIDPILARCAVSNNLHNPICATREKKPYGASRI